MSEIAQERYYEFGFPAQSDAERKAYFLQVDIGVAGKVQVFIA
jgi:hypothetical protein